MAGLTAIRLKRKPPPKKLEGQGRGPRTLNGGLLDVRAAARLLGTSEKMIRARVSRRLLPFRKFSGRVVFVRSEFEQYLLDLPGCSLDEAKASVLARQSAAVKT
jgi:hypothetical protein